MFVLYWCNDNDLIIFNGELEIVPSVDDYISLPEGKVFPGRMDSKPKWSNGETYEGLYQVVGRTLNHREDGTFYYELRIETVDSLIIK